jgi:hypothetical protein
MKLLLPNKNGLPVVLGLFVLVLVAATACASLDARSGTKRISTQPRCSCCSACPCRRSGSRADGDSDNPFITADRCACAPTHSRASQRPGSRDY